MKVYTFIIYTEILSKLVQASFFFTCGGALPYLWLSDVRNDFYTDQQAKSYTKLDGEVDVECKKEGQDKNNFCKVWIEGGYRCSLSLIHISEPTRPY